MKVKATDQFIKLNVKPIELDWIPEAGEIFEVTEERYKVLKGNNAYNVAFVEEVKAEVITIEPEVVEVAKKEVKTEKAVKKSTKKKK